MAKVGSKPITKAQLQAVLAVGRKQYFGHGITFPARGTAEYRLLQEQAIDFLVQQSLAHQADAELGIKPADRVVTDASWRKVVSTIHVSDAQVQATFAKNPTKWKRGPNRTLDLGTATEIRSVLLEKERAAAMHRFVTDAERRWPVTYAPGYRPVSEMALARRVWTKGPRKACDLPSGNQPYAEARAHGCLGDLPLPGDGSPACSLINLGDGDSGFSGAEVHDGYADYVGNNGDPCISDPRVEGVEVQGKRNTAVTAVKVSYLHRSGSATYRDPFLGFTLRYPRRLHARQISYGDLTSVEGAAVANFEIDPSAPYPQLSARAVELSFTDEQSDYPPGAAPIGKNLPIELSNAFLTAGTHTMFVAADGMTLGLTLRTGSSPSREDLEAMRAIAMSIEFPPLRVGHFSPNHLYVLGRTSSYPLGSVTEIPGMPKLKSGRFYLEHTADGFWMITWPDNLLHGYKACGPHYDAKLHVFRCPSGAVWDVKGDVLKNPDPAHDQDDALQRTQVTIGDGDVLVELPPPL